MDCLLFAGVRCRFFRFFASESVWRRILKVGGELKDNDWKQNETKNNKVLNWDIIVDVVNPFSLPSGSPLTSKIVWRKTE